MASFTDCLGRTFTLRLTLGHRARLRDLGIDTADIATALGTLAAVTGNDADRLLAVCHAVTVEPVTLAEYADGFDPAAIDAAGEALADAVADFYLSRRPHAAAAVKAKVRQVMAELDQRLADRLTSSGSGTSSPASAPSTPAPTP